MAVLGASRSLQIRLELPTCILIGWTRKVHASPDTTKVHVPTAHTCRRLVGGSRGRPAICRQGARENDPGETAGKPSAFYKLVEQLPHYKDDKGATLEFIKTNCCNESAEISSEKVRINGGNGINIKTLEEVEKLAIELLAGRAFTTSELRKKLRGKKFPTDIVDAVIADMKDRGLLDDGLYAESFSRSRWLSSTWGPRRLKQALLQKGVSEVEADRAIKGVFKEDDDIGCGHKTRHEISESSMDHLFHRASKQWLRGQSLPQENRRARIVRWLQYRGFSWTVRNAIIKRLEAQYLS